MKARLLLAALLVAAACAMAWLAVYQVDDAFIVYRYARNLAQGAGLVFNPGERVEGITCFLWAVLLAPFHALGASLPRVAPLLTAACGLGTIAVTVRRHADLEERDRIAPRDLVPALLLAAAPSFIYWSVGALETVPFALLVALAVRDHARGASIRSAVWLGLATLTRPEAPLIVLALGLDRLLAGRVAGAARWAGTVAAFFVPFLLFRRAYYGEWLPNTYYAKTGAPLGFRIAAGADYLREGAAALVPSFGVTSSPVAALGLVVLVGVVVLALRDRRLRAEGLVVVALASACVVEGGDWMVFGRFLVPALPAIAVVAGAGLVRLSGGGRIPRAVAAGVVAAFVASGFVAAEKARNGGVGLVVQREGYRHAHERIAAELARRAGPGDAVALMDVGMIGWYADALRVIDITGLTDRDIGHAPGPFLDKRYPVAGLLARKPRFVVLVPGFDADERIHDDAAFRAGYRLLFSVNHRFNWNPPNTYDLNVFERVTR